MSGNANKHRPFSPAGEPSGTDLMPTLLPVPVPLLARRCQERRGVLGRKSVFSGSKPPTQTSREMLKVILLFIALVAAVGCSYVQMQPKGSDRPPAPAVPRLP